MKYRTVTVRPIISFKSEQHKFCPIRVISNVDLEFDKDPPFPCMRSNFSSNRHFFGHWDANHQTIMRHKDSNLHSFRTAVCREWVFSGYQKYTLCIEHYPYQNMYSYVRAIGIGVVTPDANINSELAWTPGMIEGDPSYGICFENEEHRVNVTEVRRLPVGHVVHVGHPQGSLSCPRLPGRSVAPLTLADSAFKVIIDATKRTLEIFVEKENPDDEFKSVDEPVLFMNLGDESVSNPPPLALAIALKYAGDTVSIYPE